MSGFGGGGMGSSVQDLLSQLQMGQGAGVAGDASATTTPAAGGQGPGEPRGGYPQYGQQGNYNSLTQDMSRGYMGNWNFNNNQFGYNPYGNPYMQQPPPMVPPGMPPGGGGGGWPGRPPNIMGGYGGGGFGGYGGYGGGGFGGGYGGFSMHKPSYGGMGGRMPMRTMWYQ